MGKFVHVTADRVRNGMRGLEQLIEKDEAWKAELREAEQLEKRHREQWDAAKHYDDGDPGRGG